MPRRPLLSLALLAILATLALSPLDAQTVPGPTEPMVEVSLTCLSLANDLEGLHVRVGDELKPLLIPSITRSRPLRYRGPAAVAFVRLIEQAEGPPLPVTVATGQLPAGTRQALLLFLPHPDPGPGRPEFGVLAFDDDLAGFPVGHFRLINGASRPLAIALGEARVILQPGQQQVADPKTADREYCDLSVIAERDGEWILAFSSRQLHSTRLRYVAFLTDAGPNSTAVTVKVIPDLPEAEP